MLDFRKTFLTFAAVGLVFAGTASAQIVPTVTSPGTTVPQYVAIEGMTELLPPVTFATTGTVVNAITFTLTANVPITNQTLSGSSNLDVVAVDSAGNKAAVTLMGASSIQIAFATAPATLSSITVSGVRVNASATTSPTITLTPSSSPAQNIVFTGAGAGAVIEAYPAKSLAAPGVVGAPNVAVSSTSPTIANLVATLTVTGGFTGTFKTATDITAGGAIVATQGTRLAVTFTNLNANVNYYVPLTAGNGSAFLTAYTAATGNTAATAVTGITFPSNLTTTGTSFPAGLSFVQLPAPVGGSSTIYYGVTGEVTSTAGVATIVLGEVVPSQGAVTAVSSTGAGVSIAVVGPASGYPQYSTTATPYTGTQTTAPFGLLTLSQTTLLFPYVTNTQGYDMGFSIANASTGLPGTSPGSGTCTISFYGTAAPSAPFVTPVIPTGTITAGILSNIAPGFDGYLIAVCNFQAAYGYAIISNGFATGTGGVSGNYIAVPMGQ